MHLRRLVLLGAGLAAIAVGSARACPDPATKTAVNTRRPASAAALLAWKPRAWAPNTASATSGLQVQIDPVDGAYSMPAPGQTRSILVPAEDEPVAVTRRMDGSVRAQLDERFADFAVVTLGPDGKPRWTCVHGSTQADKFMRAPAPALPPAPGTVWEEK
jgi:hypothetical protein